MPARLDCHSLVVSLYNPDDNLIRCVYAWVDGVPMDPGHFPPLPLAPESRGLQSRVIHTGEPLLITDMVEEAKKCVVAYYARSDGTLEEEPDGGPQQTRSAIMVPIKLEGRVLGAAHVSSHYTNAFTQGDVQMLESLMIQVAAASRNAFLFQQSQEEIRERKRVEEENARLLRQAKAAAAQQRVFLREVLASVSEGRLRLCERPRELPRALTQQGTAIRLSPERLQLLRRRAAEAANKREFTDNRQHDLVLGVGEAAMNAVVHGRQSRARLCADEETVQIWIKDKGKGIAFENLHRATLERGFTTAGTLGHGFSIILKTVDRVWLMTGPLGTTVVLEQDRQPADTTW